MIGNEDIQTASRKIFGPRQLDRVGSLLGVARELTGDYFSLASADSKEIPYEVRTAHCLDPNEIVEEKKVLAAVSRFQYRDKDFGRPRDLYRVNLQDHNILSALRQGDRQVRFSPLLLYVLTHELVHIIRFVKFLTPFYQDRPEKEAEERRVHEITQRILGSMKIEGMGEILARYEPHSQEKPESLSTK